MGHNHDHSERQPHRTIGIAFFLNLLFTLVEFAGGIWTNSLAILSDALHDLGDCMALGVAWYLQVLAKRQKDAKYTYGYDRFSTLGALINSVILLIGCALILREAIPRLWTPELPHTTGMIGLAILGVLVNGLAASFLHSGHSLNERTAYFHLLEDVLGWIVVLIGSLFMHFYGWSIIDPILSILVALFIFYNAIKYLRQTYKIFMQRTPDELDYQQILEAVESIEGVDQVHDVHCWSLDGDYHILTAHVVVSSSWPGADRSSLKRSIKEKLKTIGIGHATLELEGSDEDCISL